MVTVDNLNNVREIGNEAFSSCRSLKSFGSLENVTHIGRSAFHDCKALTGVGDLRLVTSIGESAFENCIALTDAGDLSQVTTIGYEAFGSCRVLEHVGSLKSAVTIGEYAFSGCYALADVGSLESDRPDVVRVQDGVAQAVGLGTATLTARVGEASATAEARVYQPVTGFDLPEEIWCVLTAYTAEPVEIRVTNVQPEGAEPYLTWTATPSGGITLDAGEDKCLVQATTARDYTLTAADENGVSRSTLIHYCDMPSAVSFAESDVTVAAGRTVQLHANVVSGGQTYENKLVKFTTNNKDVAIVNEDTGLVTGVAPGQVWITARFDRYILLNGKRYIQPGVVAQCALTVTEGSGALVLPGSLKKIEAEAFVGIPAETVVFIPDSVTEIEAGAFASGVILSAAEGSEAQRYAGENGLEFWAK